MSERIEGYSYTAPDGETIRVPAGKVTEAAGYQPRPMSREEATDVAIAFGVATESRIPIKIRPVAAPDGKIGWSAEVPLEFLAGLEDVAAYREGKRWV